MSNIAVVYQSRYGYTQKYAEWIAGALHAQLFERKQVTAQQLSAHDVVIFGGGLYAGSIAGYKAFAKLSCPKVVVFTVGITNPQTTDFAWQDKRNFEKSAQKPLRVFHFHGGIDYSKMSGLHKMMMGMMKKMVIGKKPAEQMTDQERILQETYGKTADFSQQSAITPLVEYVQQLL